MSAHLSGLREAGGRGPVFARAAARVIKFPKYAGEWLCMHRHPLMSFPNASFGGNLYLFECSHLNLSNALARHFEFYRKVFQCLWFIDEMARLEDAPFAIVED